MEGHTPVQDVKAGRGQKIQAGLHAGVVVEDLAPMSREGVGVTFEERVRKLQVVSSPDEAGQLVQDPDAFYLTAAYLGLGLEPLDPHPRGELKQLQGLFWSVDDVLHQLSDAADEGGDGQRATCGHSGHAAVGFGDSALEFFAAVEAQGHETVVGGFWRTGWSRSVATGNGSTSGTRWSWKRIHAPSAEGSASMPISDHQEENQMTAGRSSITRR